MRACQSLVLLASMTALAACHKWAPMTGSPSEAITYGRPEEARLHLLDERTQMRSPWIEADEVHGFVLGLVVVGTVACPGGLMDGC